MKKYCLYIHINKTNGKVYIGITSAIHPNLRWKNGHGYKRYNKHFWAAIQKYGWDGFLHIIVRTDLALNEACELEKRYIYLFRADDKRYGYNQTKGGEGCDKGKNCYDPDVRREKQRLNAKKQRTINHEKCNERARSYYHTHRDRCREAQKQWYEAHKEERKGANNQYNKQWREQNPEKAREIRKRYRLKKKLNNNK